MPPPSPIPSPVEAGPDTDRAVAVAYLRDTKGKPCRPAKATPGGEWAWCPGGAGSAYAPIPKFSTDWGAAGQLAGYLAESGWTVLLVMSGRGCSVALYGAAGTSPGADADRFPLALCRAALAVAEAEKARKT